MVIAMHSTHWARIELQVGKDDFLAFNNIPDPFPVLRSLVIRLTDCDHDIPTVTAMSTAPNLTALRLPDECHRLRFLPDLEATLTSLTALNVLGSDLASPLEYFPLIAAHLPHLLHLSTSGLGEWDGIVNTRRAPAVVLFLKSRLLHASTEFFQFLDTPTLEHLEVQMRRFRSASYLRELLSRSARQLKHLTLELFTFYSLTPSFSAVPSLTTLELLLHGGGATQSGAIDLLQRADLLPHLRTLIITTSLVEGTYPAFLAVLRARRVLVHAELHVRPMPGDERVAPLADDILAGFAELVAQGRTISVTAPKYGWPIYIRDPEAVGDLASLGQAKRQGRASTSRKACCCSKTGRTHSCSPRSTDPSCQGSILAAAVIPTVKAAPTVNTAPKAAAAYCEDTSQPGGRSRARCGDFWSSHSNYEDRADGGDSAHREHRAQGARFPYCEGARKPAVAAASVAPIPAVKSAVPVAKASASLPPSPQPPHPRNLRSATRPSHPNPFTYWEPRAAFDFSTGRPAQERLPLCKRGPNCARRR
ncbi:hypothetical protein C8R44DRAFT_882251 [Mycena epipterygia]|nr:hypothetical protein C8R44DRAFT_882251 [Mycena epipterygia]